MDFIEAKPARAGDNSLPDLAARIRAEHEAADSALKDGLKHALAAGGLLIEAKVKLKHGQWAAWLAEHCSISERTAQCYMRVARSLGNLEAVKAQRVADLSFRDALRSLASTGLMLEGLPEASYDRALQAIDDHDHAETFRNVVRRVRIEDKVAQFSLESRAMAPPGHGRRIRVARNPAKRQWLIAIGPDITLADLKERERLAREDERVLNLQQEHDELIARAAALEAEAKAVRDDASSVNREVSAQVREIVGPVKPFTETYDFQCEDDAIDAEIAAASDDDRVDRLLRARGAADGPLRETDRGYYGDMKFMSYQDISPGPGPWTRVGSPEWLDELFPGWGAKAPEREAEEAAP
jgi:hypothetical protein